MREFSFMGTSISVSENRDRYNKIRLQYKHLAQKAESKFREDYKKNNYNIDDVINKSYEQGISIIYMVIKDSVEKLLDMKLYNINESVYIEKYCSSALMKWQDAYDTVNDKYIDIIMDEQQKDEYRKLRKAARGKWQGGGFGLGGAIKGAATAGAMNMATGMAYSAVNAVGKIGSSIKANKEKSELFKDESTLEILSKGIFNTVWNLQYSYMECLEKEAMLKFECVYPSDYKEANVIISNLKKIKIEDSDKIELLKKIINLNPYNEDIYISIINDFGDRDNEISNLAEYFGIKIYNYKVSCIEKKLKLLDTNNEVSAKKAREIIEKERLLLGVDTESHVIKKLDKKIEKFDIDARTVENILFETKEEAKLARREISKIKKILSKIDMNSEEGIQNAIKIVKQSEVQPSIQNMYVEKLTFKLQDIDVKERTEDGIVFNTLDEVALAREEKIEIEKILQEYKINKKSIKNLIERISNEFKTDIKYKYIKQLELELDEFSINQANSAMEFKKNKKRIKRYKIGWFVYWYFAIVGLFAPLDTSEMLAWIIFMILVWRFYKKKYTKVKNSYNESKNAIEELNIEDKINIQEA